jgi:nitrate reductase beta subunit
MDKITSGPNWEEILGGEFEKRAKDQNFDNMQKVSSQFGPLVILSIRWPVISERGRAIG